jgi:hypothetical protein
MRKTSKPQKNKEKQMKSKNIRKITTRMYGQRAFDILDSLHGQMSDGYWENRNYDKYWTNFDVRRGDDDRVYFEVNSNARYEYWRGYHTGLIDTKPNPFAEMDDAKFKAWLAGRLRKMIGVEAKDKKWPDGWWSRTSAGLESGYLNRELDVTVADVYRVYDELKGRAGAFRDERIAGHPAPASVAQGRKKIARAKQEAKAAYDAARTELDRLFQAAQNEYEADKTALWKDYCDKVRALDPDGGIPA